MCSIEVSNPEFQIHTALRLCLKENFPNAALPDQAFDLRALAEREYGDLTSNVAIFLSRIVPVPSESIAAQIAEALVPTLKSTGIADVSAQRSFINFTVRRLEGTWWYESGMKKSQKPRDPKILIFGRPSWLSQLGYMRLVAVAILHGVVSSAVTGRWPQFHGAIQFPNDWSSPWESVRAALLAAIDAPVCGPNHTSEWSKFGSEMTYFCAPESVPSGEFKRLSVELKNAGNGLSRLHVPTREWLTVSEEMTWRELIEGAKGRELRNLLLYLASPVPGLELDATVSRLSERANLGEWLEDSCSRLNRIAGNVFCSTMPDNLEELLNSENLRFLGVRSWLLPKLLLQSINDGSVSQLCLGIAQILNQLCSTLNTPQLRIRIAAGGLTDVEAYILYGVWRTLSASISWFQPLNTRAMPGS